MVKRPVTTYHLIVVLAVALTLSAMSLIISLRVNRNTEEKFCATAIDRVEGYRLVPPPTPSGREQAKRAEALVKSLHCPDGKFSKVRVTPSPYGYPPSSTGK
jgi:cytochrome c-type biogenesis protein CcmH/NrfF